MKLNFKEYGKGVPIIILHGLLGMLDNWHSFAKKLAETYWVISIDQRNHGKSFHDPNFNYKLLSEDLFSFLQELHIPRCNLIGHSMGGKTALKFINEYPGIVDKSIIVDISPKEYNASHDVIFNSLRNIDLSKMKSRKEIQNSLMEKLNNLPVVLFLMKNLSRNQDGTYRWKANIEALYNNYNNISQSILLEDPSENEVLFIKAENSDYIKEEEFDSIQEQYPFASFKTIKNAGHWVHIDNSEELLQTVLDYLE